MNCLLLPAHLPTTYCLLQVTVAMDELRRAGHASSQVVEVRPLLFAPPTHCTPAAPTPPATATPGPTPASASAGRGPGGEGGVAASAPVANGVGRIPNL